MRAVKARVWRYAAGAIAERREFAALLRDMDARLLLSTEILFAMEPAQTIARTFPAEPMAGNDEFEAGPAWPHTHTLGVVQDQVFLSLTQAWLLLTLLPFRGACNGRKGSVLSNSTFLSRCQRARFLRELPLRTGAAPKERCLQ